jgi:hypothetical protein
MFQGQDCCSLAVTIGAGMDLRPITLLHSTRRKDKLGLMSLTKYNLSLVMGFLEEVGWQAILPSSRAKKDFVAPTSTSPPPFLPPPLCEISEVHNPFILLRLGLRCFSVLGLCSGVVMLFSLFSCFFFFFFFFFFLIKPFNFAKNYV